MSCVAYENVEIEEIASARVGGTENVQALSGVQR